MTEDKKVPLGKPLNLTDAELEKLATVTEEDQKKARLFWRKHAPDRFWDLLDAVAVDDYGYQLP